MKIICFLSLLLTFSSFSQTTYRVKDTLTGESMPFVKVLPNIGQPQFTDIDGKFLVSSQVQTVLLRFQGYRDTLVLLSSVTDRIIYMDLSEQIVQEVVALAGENPAHRIINKVIENRKKNHPLENDAFTYTSYSKFIFDTDSSFSESIKDIPATDSLSAELDLFRTQHLFMLESASERSFIPPARDRENIIAYKVSGLTHPAFSSFAQSMQSFHFYDNQFDLLGTQYVNPIAFGGTNRYLFILQDTTVIGSDTTFAISYRPRMGKTFSGLQGMLYINTNGYAIEKVIANPYKRDSTLGFDVKIIQDYQLLDGKKWFPRSLSTRVDMRGATFQMGDNNGYLIGRGNTYIKEILINPEGLKKRGFNNIALSTEEGAGEVKDEVWNDYRIDTLTQKEEKTYHTLDSLGEEFKIDQKIDALIALSTGKLRIKYVNLLLNRIIDANIYEDLRIGLGLETSDLVMKNIAIGGYFAYGTRDKGWKYGGHTRFYLNKRLGMELSLKYEQDLLQRGNNSFTTGGWNLQATDGYARFYKAYMDKQRLAEIKYSIEPRGNLRFHVSANYQRVEFTQGYGYKRINDSPELIPVPYNTTRIDFAETSFEMQWNIREKVNLLGYLRIAKPSNYPKIALKLTKGIAGIGEANTDYLRAHVRVSEDLKLLRFGILHLRLEASQTFGNVPLALSQYAVGTRQNWNVSVTNSFETVFPGEFYHDRQAAFFFRYSFPEIRTKAKWNEPQFIVHHAIGFGDMDRPAEHLQTFKTMDRGLYEVGLIFGGILKVNTISLGVGAFYRYGVYSDTNALKNLVPKLSITIAGFGQ